MEKPENKPQTAKAGTKPLHLPVMLQEVLTHLQPALVATSSPRYLDGTFGRGGHLREVLRAYPAATAVGLDRDPEAIAYGNAEFAEPLATGRMQLTQLNFKDFTVEQFGLFDAMLVDLGVSSPQLDEGRRGFSFYQDGPLDMRMDTTEGPTAADLIATMTEAELNKMFQNLGEIQKPFRVVRAIVHDRQTTPFTSTRELASLIERVEGWRRKGFHPATQYFMALRLHVNQELEAVTESLRPLMLGLKPRGRLAVLTFHSLEDRIVKNVFKEATDLGSPVFKKVIPPGREEEKANPRARSAKLRIFERRSHEDDQAVLADVGKQRGPAGT